MDRDPPLPITVLVPGDESVVIGQDTEHVHRQVTRGGALGFELDGILPCTTTVDVTRSFEGLKVPNESVDLGFHVYVARFYRGIFVGSHVYTHGSYQLISSVIRVSYRADYGRFYLPYLTKLSWVILQTYGQVGRITGNNIVG